MLTSLVLLFLECFLFVCFHTRGVKKKSEINVFYFYAKSCKAVLGGKS